MSELINTRKSQNHRLQLLSMASSAVLLLSACVSQEARASDADHPTVWIELGGQLERVDGGQEPFAPSFDDAISHAGFTSPAFIQRPASYSNGAQGKISFTPSDSDWVFSASIRYGRSNAARHVHQEKTVPPTYFYRTKYHTTVKKTASNDYADTVAKNNETHSILDFQAGKDFGLGLFGHNDTSTFNFGVRVAQFTSKSTAVMYARPDNHFVSGLILGKYNVPLQHYHQYTIHAQSSRSFKGIGPSISWDTSAAVLGNSASAAVMFDWGINAALLFGRQKVIGHHQSVSALHYYAGDLSGNYKIADTPHTADPNRARSANIPNVGGFAGLSFKFPNAKVSLGYRADFFFGAMDGGIDTVKKENRGFYGPFATISVGLGG